MTTYMFDCVLSHKYGDGVEIPKEVLGRIETAFGDAVRKEEYVMWGGNIIERTPLLDSMVTFYNFLDKRAPLKSMTNQLNNLYQKLNVLRIRVKYGYPLFKSRFD